MMKLAPLGSTDSGQVYPSSAGAHPGCPRGRSSPVESLEKLHFGNWIDCMRSRKWQDLNADTLEGHMSTATMHLGNISYRTGRKPHFNPNSERFINDEDADSCLPRDYRPPYVAPDTV